ncbi:transposase zinc-binding domain-containing protein [Myxococcota bacterium]|nr:transposase zinc-binding domain-containing protein [Myxococcota bacterium]MBU1535268.1 transposase zinc-binding domain-containing protein [Myxococcota bacterium]
MEVSVGNITQRRSGRCGHGQGVSHIFVITRGDVVEFRHQESRGGGVLQIDVSALTEHEPLPHHIEQEFAAYIRCGILAHGFVRLKCTDCEKSFAVPFSAKGAASAHPVWAAE